MKKGSLQFIMFIISICVLVTDGEASNNQYIANISVLADSNSEMLKPIKKTEKKNLNKDFTYALTMRMYKIAVCEFEAIPQGTEEDEGIVEYIKDIEYGERWYLRKEGKFFILDALFTDTPDGMVKIQVFEGTGDIDPNMEFENDGCKKVIILPDGKIIKKIIEEEMLQEISTGIYTFDRVYQEKIKKTKKKNIKHK